MAAGPLLPQAIADLGALPKDAYERVVAQQILLNMRHVLGSKPDHTPQEQEFIVTMHTSWAKTQKNWRAEGLVEGRTKEASQAVLTVLRVRSVAVPEAVRERILAEKDLRSLKRWLKKAATAVSIAEVIDVPS